MSGLAIQDKQHGIAQSVERQKLANDFVVLIYITRLFIQKMYTWMVQFTKKDKATDK